MPYLFEDMVVGSFFSGIGAFEKALATFDSVQNSTPETYSVENDELTLLLCLVLTSCDGPYAGEENYEQNTDLVALTEKNNLYYDPDTKIVYFIFNERSGYAGYGYMSPYYADNGLPYLYDANSQSVQ